VLIEVVVAVDQARRGQPPAAVDPAPAEPVRRRAGADRGDPVVLDDEVAVRELPPLRVDGGDGAALDDRDALAQSGGIYSLGPRWAA
jgi:hypothetical protein